MQVWCAVLGHVGFEGMQLDVTYCKVYSLFVLVTAHAHVYICHKIWLALSMILSGNSSLSTMDASASTKQATSAIPVQDS